MSNDNERLILSALRQKPMSVPNIAKTIGKHPQTIRKTIKALKERRQIVKGPMLNGVPTLSIAPYMKRERPMLRVWSSEWECFVYTGIESFLGFLQQRTKGAEAADMFPQYVSKLLMIGFKYNTIKDQWTMEAGNADDLKAKLAPLRRELRSLRTQFDGDYDAMEYLFDLFTQLKSEEFWSLENLGNHFNKQLDYDANLIPPVDSREVVEASSLL